MDGLVRGREGERLARAAEKPGPGGLRKLWALSHHAGCLQSRHLPDCGGGPRKTAGGGCLLARDRVLLLAPGTTCWPVGYCEPNSPPMPQASRPGGEARSWGSSGGRGQLSLERSRRDGKQGLLCFFRKETF